jgi:hypothetical protein
LQGNQVFFVEQEHPGVLPKTRKVLMLLMLVLVSLLIAGYQQCMIRLYQ